VEPVHQPNRPWSIIALLAWCLLIWWRTVHSGTIDTDTPWLVLENPLLSTGDLRVIPALFTDFSVGTRLTLGAEYLPFRDLTVLLDFAFFGGNPIGHHIQNLVWYVIGCIGFAQVASNLLLCKSKTWMATAAFAAHPLHAESVAWLASRKDLVSLAATMGALWLWTRPATNNRSGWKDVATLLALSAVAMWSKNTAVILPALMAIISLGCQREHLRNRAKWWGLGVVSLLMLVGTSISMKVGSMVHMFAAPRATSIPGKLQVQAHVIGHYLESMAWPTHLAAMYKEPQIHSWHQLWAPIASIACLILVGLWCWKRRPVVAVGIGWFFISLLPVSQIVPIQNLIADRYMLIPSAGIVLALSAMLPRLDAVPKDWKTGLPWLACATWTLCLGAISSQHSTVWQSSLSLWENATENQPDVPTNHTRLAAAQADAGQIKIAKKTLFDAQSKFPSDATISQALGQLHLKIGDIDTARSSFESTLQQDPTKMKAANNLAIILKSDGENEAALTLATQLTQNHPLYSEGWNTLGAILIDQNDLSGAMQALHHALRLTPFDAEVLMNLGNVAYLQKQTEQAESYWKQAFARDPDNPVLQHRLRELKKRKRAEENAP